MTADEWDVVIMGHGIKVSLRARDSEAANAERARGPGL